MTVPLSAAELSSSKPVTFSKDVAPIFQEKCQDCHRKGTVAPMSLITYEEARPWAKAIKDRVVARQMPPWHIDQTIGVRHFQNDMSLSAEQMATIVKWVDSGAPQGDPKDMPEAKQWNDDNDWKATSVMGRPPDMVIKSEPYTMPAHSQDQWWRPLADIPITEPMWVKAVEIRPGTNAGRKITHHALAHLVQENDPDAQKFSDQVGDGRSPNEAGTLMEWAIGKSYDIYRDGSGKLILPGSHIWWDIHYHAAGETVRDHVEIGVWFYPKDQTPTHRTYLTGFQSTSREGTRLDIPPNSQAVSDGYTVLKAAARLENFQPHMHLRGKAMSMEAILPDGTIQMISNVDKFDFNWMTNYIYADDEAPVLPKGTIVHIKTWFDNTAAHKGNPDPDQWVGWGDRTVDEMAHAWVNVTYLSDSEYDQWAAQHKPKNNSRRAAGN
jgi:hypothetical protein